MPEKLLAIAPNGVVPEIDRVTRALFVAIKSRIPEPELARVPHRSVAPIVLDGILTVAIQDQRRRLPIMRLYYHVLFPAFGQRSEREVRMDPGDFSDEERRDWEQLARE